MILIQNLLAYHPLFSLLSEAEQRRCAAAFQSVSYRTGEAVYHTGQAGDAGCFLAQGKVRIVSEGSIANSCLGTFRAGTFFAAHSRPEQWLRTSSCRAAEDSQILHLPREFVEQLLNDYPDLTPYLDKTVEDAVRLETLSLGHLLAAVPGSQIVAVLDFFEEVHVAAEEVIVRQGDAGDAMYVVHQGKLEVRKCFSDGERRLCDLLPGDYFGERALVLDEPRFSSVVAIDDCKCFKLDRAGFDRLRGIVPSFTRQLLAQFVVYEATLKDVSQHADVWLVPVGQHDVGSSQLAALGSGVAQHQVLSLLGLTLFTKGLSAGSVPAVISCLRSVEFKRGARLPGAGLFIIRSGTVRRSDEHSTRAWLSKGEVFGAMRTLGEATAPSYVVTDDVELYSLNEHALAFLDESVPHWHSHMRQLAAHEWLCGPPLQERKQAPESVERHSCTPRCDTRDSQAVGTRRCIRWIGQRTPNACGLAALAMVMHAHGMPGDYDELKRRHQLLPRGMTILQMRELAESLGFATDVVELDLSEIGAEDLPAIALWHESHYVVVFRIGKSTLIVGDPAVGLIKMSRARFGKVWSGRMLRLVPTHKVSPIESETVS